MIQVSKEVVPLLYFFQPIQIKVLPQDTFIEGLKPVHVVSKALDCVKGRGSVAYHKSPVTALGQ